MSKLYDKYLKLKDEFSSDILLFKNGIFYIALDIDAVQLSELFNFKLSNLNQDVVKCGFPQTRLSYYSKLLTENNVSFRIVETQISTARTYSDFMNNAEFEKMVLKLSEIDMDNTTCLEAFNILYEFSEIIKKVRSETNE